MFKKLTLSFLIVSIFIFFSYCSRSLQRTQIKFGITAAQKELWEEAIFRWERALQVNPNSAAAHNNLAVAYEKKGLLEKAQEEYEKALKLSPNNKYIKANYEKLKKTLESDLKENKEEKKTDDKK